MNRTYEDVGRCSNEIQIAKRAGWKLHCLQSPALVEYHYSGTIARERWARDGKSHREDAPAIIWYDLLGGYITGDWFFYGEWILVEDTDT